MRNLYGDTATLEESLERAKEKGYIEIKLPLSEELLEKARCFSVKCYEVITENGYEKAINYNDYKEHIDLYALVINQLKVEMGEK